MSPVLAKPCVSGGMAGGFPASASQLIRRGSAWAGAFLPQEDTDTGVREGETGETKGLHRVGSGVGRLASRLAVRGRFGLGPGGHKSVSAHSSEGISCIVLAGGGSLRFGRDKVQEELEGETLLLRAVRALAPLTAEVIVATAPGGEIKLPERLSVRTVTDFYPGRGPLAGIHAGLSAATSSHSLVVASDMPFLNRRLIRHMTEICAPHDVVIPRHCGLLEPLHAVYSKGCMGPIEAVLEKGENRIVAFFPAVNVRYLEEVEIERYDRRHRSFFNINSRADLERARAGRGGHCC